MHFLTLPANSDPVYPIPDDPDHAVHRAQIVTDAKVVFIASCYIGQYIKILWNISPKTTGRALVVPVLSPGQPTTVLLGHASTYWVYLLLDLLGPQHMTVGAAVKDVNNKMGAMRVDSQGNPILERWQVIGDPNVQAPL